LNCLKKNKKFHEINADIKKVLTSGKEMISLKLRLGELHLAVRWMRIIRPAACLNTLSLCIYYTWMMLDQHQTPKKTPLFLGVFLFISDTHIGLLSN
jgi:Na+-translocating ferredoxin:NAD+ oxidoreductase RnfD subunit